MTKTIVVGDIHGHVDTVERALASPHNVVFVGDYLDSFNRTVEEQIACLTMIMDAIEDPDRNVVGLLGNHELSYLDPKMRCSGYNPATQVLVNHLRDRMERTLLDYVWLGDNLLVSHAGVSARALYPKETVDSYLETGEFKQIGWDRGGAYGQVGGLFWCDWEHEMEPVEGLIQIVGHSNRKKPGDPEGTRKKISRHGTGAVYCIDHLCRVQEGLLVENGIVVGPVAI